MTHRVDAPGGTDPESGEPTPRTAPIAWGRGLLARTGVAIRGAVGRRDGRATLLVVAALYLLTYLWALRDLTATGPGGQEDEAPTAMRRERYRREGRCGKTSPYGSLPSSSDIALESYSSRARVGAVTTDRIAAASSSSASRHPSSS